MKLKSIWVLVLIGILTYSNGTEKQQVNLKKPVELVFDTKVSCKDVKPYLLFLNTITKNERETFCSNDNTDGTRIIIDSNKPKIVYEPTSINFSEFVEIDEKVYDVTKDNKACIQPIEIAYFDLDDDGIKEIFIKRISQDKFFELDILKKENRSFKKLLPYSELLRMDEGDGKILILQTKTIGLSDILLVNDMGRGMSVVDILLQYTKNLTYSVSKTIFK